MRLGTGRPFTSCVTAISIDLPLRVRGSSLTCRIRFGTWRGLSSVRMVRWMRATSASSSVTPARSTTNSQMTSSSPSRLPTARPSTISGMVSRGR